jgi:hypothetical protein
MVRLAETTMRSRLRQSRVAAGLIVLFLGACGRATGAVDTPRKPPLAAEAADGSGPPSDAAVGTPPRSASTDRATDAPVLVRVGCLRDVAGDTTCQETGGIFTYAETDARRIYICADKRDPNRPRSFRSRNRNGSPGLDLEAVDYVPWLARAFVFRDNGYTYTLTIPQGTVGSGFTIETPTGQIASETVTRYLALTSLSPRCR